jgi:hypothetical protein
MTILRIRFLLYSILGFVLGLTWVLALAAIFTEGQSLEMWYTFIVMHGLQVVVKHSLVEHCPFNSRKN